MAKLGCKCGHILWNGECPNDIQYWVYSDKKLDKIFNYNHQINCYIKKSSYFGAF